MYYGAFENWNDVLGQFEVEASEVPNAVPLFASYDNGGYEGAATVVYIDDGKFWLVTGSHCSCYGLEGMWEPEDMPYEALVHLAQEGDYSFSAYQKEFIATLDFVKDNGFDNVEPEELQFFLKLAI